jgi:hypothetical protein
MAVIDGDDLAVSHVVFHFLDHPWCHAMRRRRYPSEVVFRGGWDESAAT